MPVPCWIQQTASSPIELSWKRPWRDDGTKNWDWTLTPLHPPKIQKRKQTNKQKGFKKQKKHKVLSWGKAFLSCWDVFSLWKKKKFFDLCYFVCVNISCECALPQVFLRTSANLCQSVCALSFDIQYLYLFSPRCNDQNNEPLTYTGACGRHSEYPFP